jgi:hypothetical protein
MRTTGSRLLEDPPPEETWEATAVRCAPGAPWLPPPVPLFPAEAGGVVVAPSGIVVVVGAPSTLGRVPTAVVAVAAGAAPLLVLAVVGVADVATGAGAVVDVVGTAEADWDGATSVEALQICAYE